MDDPGVEVAGFWGRTTSLKDDRHRFFQEMEQIQQMEYGSLQQESRLWHPALFQVWEEK